MKKINCENYLECVAKAAKIDLHTLNCESCPVRKYSKEAVKARRDELIADKAKIDQQIKLLESYLNK